ncbi:hypothetical protein KM043_005905 [Ampulex compressa]|nr:hypothetical protein KM043_005905 [Ampulex compressa]
MLLGDTRWWRSRNFLGGIVSPRQAVEKLEIVATKCRPRNNSFNFILGSAPRNFCTASLDEMVHLDEFATSATGISSSASIHPTTRLRGSLYPKVVLQSPLEARVIRTKNRHQMRVVKSRAAGVTRDISAGIKCELCPK